MEGAFLLFRASVAAVFLIAGERIGRTDGVAAVVVVEEQVAAVCRTGSWPASGSTAVTVAQETSRFEEELPVDGIHVDIIHVEHFGSQDVFYPVKRNFHSFCELGLSEEAKEWNGFERYQCVGTSKGVLTVILSV